MSLPSVEAIEAELIRRELRRRGLKYNEEEPRVPAGSPDGGEWTTNPGGDEAPSAPALLDKKTLRSGKGIRALGSHLAEAMGTPEAKIHHSSVTLTNVRMLQATAVPSSIDDEMLKGHVRAYNNGGRIVLGPDVSAGIEKVLAAKTSEERVKLINNDLDVRNSIRTLTHEMIHGIGVQKSPKYNEPGQVRIEEATTEFLAQAHWAAVADKLAGAPVIRERQINGAYTAWVKDLKQAGVEAKVDHGVMVKAVGEAHNLDRTPLQRLDRIAKVMAEAVGQPKYQARIQRAMHEALNQATGSLAQAVRSAIY